MTEYISREAVLQKFLERGNGYINMLTMKTMVDEIPAADVQSVKHGVWRKDEQGYDVYVECSECGLNLSISNYIENEWRETLKYCPRCGAKMIKDGDTE